MNGGFSNSARDGTGGSGPLFFLPPAGPILLDDHAQTAEPPPVALDRVGHLSLAVGDVARVRDFYVRVLGFRERPDRPPFDFGGAWLRHDCLQIHLIAAEAAFRTPLTSRGDHLAFHVPDCDAAERSLKSHGIDYRRSVQAGTGLVQLFFDDPEGNTIELASYAD